MSAVHAVPTTAAKRSLLRTIGIGVALGAILVAITIAVWPASAADKAYDDGVRVGEAVSDLYYADNATEVEDAQSELHAAIVDSRETAGDYVGGQLAAQEDALSRAVDGYVGSRTTDDTFEADLYQAELDYAVDDLANNAEDFQSETPEVRAAFWDGVDAGLNGE